MDSISVHIWLRATDLDPKKLAEATGVDDPDDPKVVERQWYRVENWAEEILIDALRSEIA